VQRHDVKSVLGRGDQGERHAAKEAEQITVSAEQRHRDLTRTGLRARDQALDVNGVEGAGERVAHALAPAGR
jgi:hypothetical protein